MRLAKSHSHSSIGLRSQVGHMQASCFMSPSSKSSVGRFLLDRVLNVCSGAGMEFHVGRIIDHVHIVVKDLAQSRRFYEAILGALGRERTMEGEHFFAYDEFF